MHINRRENEKTIEDRPEQNDEIKVKKELLLALTKGIEYWAAMEDNEVPGPLYKPYKELKALLEWEVE